MGQILHGSATATHAVRAAIQRSKAPLKELAARYGLNRKTAAKWRKRACVHDAAMGPKAPRSTVLRKPLLEITGGPDPELMFAPAIVREAVYYMLGNYRRGDFHDSQLGPLMGH